MFDLRNWDLREIKIHSLCWNCGNLNKHALVCNKGRKRIKSINEFCNDFSPVCPHCGSTRAEIAVGFEVDAMFVCQNCKALFDIM